MTVTAFLKKSNLTCQTEGMNIITMDLCTFSVAALDEQRDHIQFGRTEYKGVISLYLRGISPTHFASFPHPFASFPHQICFVSPKKCFISPTVCCISPTKCFISPTVCCISLCNVVSRCQKIFYQIFSVFSHLWG